MERVVQKVLYDSLKKSNEVTKFVTGVLPHVPKTIEFANRLSQVQEELSDEMKLELGFFMRDAGQLWNSIFMLAIA